jgi:hypothetical protein
LTATRSACSWPQTTEAADTVIAANDGASTDPLTTNGCCEPVIVV